MAQIDWGPEVRPRGEHSGIGGYDSTFQLARRGTVDRYEQP